MESYEGGDPLYDTTPGQFLHVQPGELPPASHLPCARLVYARDSCMHGARQPQNEIYILLI